MEEKVKFKDLYRNLPHNELVDLAKTAYDLNKNALSALIDVIIEKDIKEINREVLFGINRSISDQNINRIYQEKKRGFCKFCNTEKDIYALNYRWLYSIIFYTKTGEETDIGCYDCLNGRLNSAQFLNLSAGWWGIPVGIFMTPITLISNEIARAQIKKSDKLFKRLIYEDICKEIKLKL